MTSPLVSILIAAHNAEPHLAATLDAVLAQSWRGLEIIVVDDGSSDGTASIVGRYRRDARLRLVRQDARGAGAARNRAYAESRGALIKFLDADDIISADCVALQVARLQSSPGAVAVSEWARFRHDTAEARFVPDETWQDLDPVTWLTRSWAKGGGMQQCGMFLVPRGVLERSGLWNETLTLKDDFEFFARVLLSATKVLFTPGARLFYRSGIAGSVSQLTGRSAVESEFRALRDGTECLLARHDSQATRSACAAVFQGFAYEHYPAHPDLVRQMECRAKELGGSMVPPIGPPGFQLLRRIVGWRVARRIERVASRRSFTRTALMSRLRTARVTERRTVLPAMGAKPHAPRALILIGGHLCNAPRPTKEATALARAGWNVSVRGIWYDEALAGRDRALAAAAPYDFAPLLDFRGSPHSGRVRRFAVRLEGRLSRSFLRLTGFAPPAAFGYGARQMVRAGREARADLTIVHSEAGLWAGRVLQREGHRVGVDFEDWFSEDLLPDARRNRPVRQLKALERELATTSRYCLAPSRSLADGMASAYAVPVPTVIYNTFPESLQNRAEFPSMPDERAHDEMPSLHWFSQTIGPGRGLELLFEALPLMRVSVQVNLRGSLSASGRRWLSSVVPATARERIQVHALVPNDELSDRIAMHDLGLALELPSYPNRDLTVTNKIFHYLIAGLPVVATNTAGQREVMALCPGAGIVLEENSPAALAAALDMMVGNRDRLRDARRCVGNARDAIAWPAQAAKIVALAEAAIGMAP